jgi:gluconolactonase
MHMKKWQQYLSVSLLLILTAPPLMMSGQGKKPVIIARGATLEKLGSGYVFTEGPASDKEGNVYFTDQPNNQIIRWATDGTLTVFMENAGRANGLCFDSMGNLIACADQNNELWSVTPDGKITVLVHDYNGKRLNAPNDVWVAANGNIYFTDPLYKRKWWDFPMPEQDGEHVYLLSADYKTITRVTSDLVKPNGIIGTPDGKKLYVADIGAKKTYSYTINPDGLLTEKKLFCEMGSDGMTIDTKGNVYLTGNGVTVFTREGMQIAHIPVDEKWTGNVCFGGRNKRLLFITASTSVYGLRMKVTGTGSQ